MKTRVRPLTRIVRRRIDQIRAITWPVWGAIATESLAALALALVARAWAAPRIGALVDLGQLPPWRLLVAFPLVGVVGSVLRATRPDETLRRWHGVALRRVDGWFA